MQGGRLEPVAATTRIAQRIFPGNLRGLCVTILRRAVVRLAQLAEEHLALAETQTLAGLVGQLIHAHRVDIFGNKVPALARRHLYIHCTHRKLATVLWEPHLAHAGAVSRPEKTSEAHHVWGGGRLLGHVPSDLLAALGVAAPRP